MTERPSSSLRPTDLLRVGTFGLRTRRLRSALSSLGVAIGIAALVAVMGLSASSRSELLAQLDALGTNLLVVEAGQTLTGEASTLPDTAERMISAIGPVESSSSATVVEGATVRATDLVPETDTRGIAVVATDLDLDAALGLEVRAGRWHDAATERLPTVVLGSTAARRLGVTEPGVSVWIDDAWYSVIGVLDPAPLAPDVDSSALVGRPAAEELLDASTEPSTVYVRAEDESVQAVRGVLAATANPAAPEEVSVSRPSEALAAKAAASGAFTSLLLALGAVSLLVGGVGIANVMVISVLERRREVGLRRAVGATRRHIAQQFLVEALVLAAVGGAGGAVVGAIVTAAYSVVQGWTPVIPPPAVALGVGSALVIGAVAGAYPARRAARLSPTEALRSA